MPRWAVTNLPARQFPSGAVGTSLIYVSVVLIFVIALYLFITIPSAILTFAYTTLHLFL